MTLERHQDGTTLRIGFPVHCSYHGGNAQLGPHGRHLWIEDGRIGHGELRMTHSVSLADVVNVEVEPRDGGGVGDQDLLGMGIAGHGRFAHGPAVITDVTVRTRDGQEAAWVVEDRDASWVREQMGPALARSGVPFHGDIDHRTG